MFGLSVYYVVIKLTGSGAGKALSVSILSQVLIWHDNQSFPRDNLNEHMTK